MAIMSLTILMFLVPILVATFNNQTPLKLEPDNVQNPIPNPIPNVPQPVWQWQGDPQWQTYGTIGWSPLVDVHSDFRSFERREIG